MWSTGRRAPIGPWRYARPAVDDAAGGCLVPRLHAPYSSSQARRTAAVGASVSAASSGEHGPRCDPPHGAGPTVHRAGPAVLSREQRFERSWIGARHLEYLHPASRPRHQRDRAAADSERRRHRGQRSRSRLAVCSWLTDPDHQGPVVLPAHAGIGRPGLDPDSDAHPTSVHPRHALMGLLDLIDLFEVLL